MKERSTSSGRQVGAGLTAQREHFAGAALLSPVWTLLKGGRAAACTVWSHQFGFELRLVVDGDELPRTHVARTQAELIDLQATWRAALEQKDWTTGVNMANENDQQQTPQAPPAPSRDQDPGRDIRENNPAPQTRVIERAPSTRNPHDE